MTNVKIVRCPECNKPKGIRKNSETFGCCNNRYKADNYLVNVPALDRLDEEKMEDEPTRNEAEKQNDNAPNTTGGEQKEPEQRKVIPPPRSEAANKPTDKEDENVEAPLPPLPTERKLTEHELRKIYNWCGNCGTILGKTDEQIPDSCPECGARFR